LIRGSLSMVAEKASASGAEVAAYARAATG